MLRPFKLHFRRLFRARCIFMVDWTAVMVIQPETTMMILNIRGVTKMANFLDVSIGSITIEGLCLHGSA
ncbi:MAG: hypothetical protein QXD61_08340 [Candidatus Caldarchaeum sp.]